MENGSWNTFHAGNVIISWQTPDSVYGAFRPDSREVAEEAVGGAAMATASILAAVILSPQTLPLYLRSMKAIAEMVGEDIINPEQGQT